jgi:hypothetical protein
MKRGSGIDHVYNPPRMVMALINTNVCMAASDAEWRLSFGVAGRISEQGNLCVSRERDRRGDV